MSFIGLIFFVVVAIALISVRRENAPIPLLIGCCYMTMGQGIELGAVSLPVYKMLLLVGLVRVIARNERIAGGLNGVDKLIIALVSWMFTASLFHDWVPGSGPVYMSGVIFNITLIYFLIRIWCGTVEETVGVITAVAWVLAPVALEMMFEQVASKNLFGFLGGIPESVIERGGRLRAQGPFRHPILAGTVGGTCFPLMLGIWKSNRLASVVGCLSCLLIVAASASSGPIISMMAGIGIVACWQFRKHTSKAVYALIALYLLVEIISNRPAYHPLITRLDLTGSSTAYYRVRLLDTTIEHFREWWMTGTDYTRHWIPEGIGSVVAGGKHLDVTNYYIGFGISSGLMGVVLVIWIIVRSLRDVVRVTSSEEFGENNEELFMIWCVGGCLFSHAISAISIAYYDQSQTFFWLSIAILSSLVSAHFQANRLGGEEHADGL